MIVSSLHLEPFEELLVLNDHMNILPLENFTDNFTNLIKNRIEFDFQAALNSEDQPDTIQIGRR